MQYFTLDEFLKSETAEKNNIKNIPNAEQIANIEQLVAHILDPLREKFGKPIVVSSGFRCAELNAKIKGSRTSQHCKGEAADIMPKNHADLKSLFKLIILENLPFDQLIFEKGVWIHVSMKGNKQPQRGEVLTYDGNKYVKITRQQALQIFK